MLQGQKWVIHPSLASQVIKRPRESVMESENPSQKEPTQESNSFCQNDSPTLDDMLK